tara:strand:- start:1416 stop:1559 length:144 start_codon:yes stop_codon:yes gene_type:complete
MQCLLNKQINLFVWISQPREAISAGKATIIMPIDAVAVRSDVLTSKN